MPDTLEVGAIDPDIVPPTQPPSALSTDSDTSYFAPYAETESEQLDPKNALPEHQSKPSADMGGSACSAGGKTT